jgi:hypothetical protein
LFLQTAVSFNYRCSLGAASEICAQIRQRLSIPWLWQHHNLPGEPKPGGRCRSPFYHDKNPDFFIARDGSWFVDHGEPDHKGDVISFEQLAANCTRTDAIRKLRELASLPQTAKSLEIRIGNSNALEFSEKLQPMTLDFLERGNTDDLQRLATLRCIAREALESATAAGVLQFATLRSCRAWVVRDLASCVAEARRLDGKPWDHIGGAKSWTLPGGSKGRKRWALGILEAQTCRVIALVEGMPDFLAAFHWIWVEDRSDVAPVAMLGGSMSIHPVAVRLFQGKRVRIFPHYDAKRFNGFDAARKWEAQLRGAGAVVDCFDLSGLTRSDGQAVSDLNDLCSVSHEQWHDEIRKILP